MGLYCKLGEGETPFCKSLLPVAGEGALAWLPGDADGLNPSRLLLKYLFWQAAASRPAHLFLSPPPKLEGSLLFNVLKTEGKKKKKNLVMTRILTKTHFRSLKIIARQND